MLLYHLILKRYKIQSLIRNILLAVERYVVLFMVWGFKGFVRLTVRNRLKRRKLKSRFKNLNRREYLLVDF